MKSELIERVADGGTFQAWDTDVVSTDPLNFSDSRPYRERLEEARRKSHQTESVVTGFARLGGRPLALIAGHYPFLGGSVGVASGERVARAFERAAAARLPLLSLTASGGTRMQEGSLAFVQMIKAAQAVREFKSEGLLYVAYLTGPTFGGVLASWGSLAHLTFGLPGAVVGFSGPRPVEITTGRRLPEGVQTTDNLLRHGIVDDVFPLDQLSARIDALLSSLEEHPAQVAAPPRVSDRAAGDAWRSVEASRDPSRPGARDLLDACGAELTFLRGDRCGGGDDRACIAAIGSLKGRPCIVIAQDRKGGARPGSMGAEGYRKALRAMDAAAQLRLPVVTIIDTPGVALTPKAEESGLSAVIARCLERMTGLGPPTLSILLGQGAGGGALALFPADRVLAAEHAWLLPIAPEGASAIVLRSAAHAPELAAAQRGASWDLKQWGLVDAVVKEESGWVEGTAELIASELDALREESVEARLARRRRRLRALGNG